MNAYNENGNASKKSVAANDKDESLDNLKNSQREEEAIEKNIWTSDFIQQLFQEVYTDHENGIKTTIEIAKDIKKSNSDLLITKLLDELKRNLAFVADCLKDEDVTSFLNKIELEGSFKKRKNLKNDLLDRLDAPHNALGIVKLFAELYNIGLLDYDEMIQSMNSFLDSGRINHVIIECFCEFLTRVKTKMNIEYPCQFVKYVVKLELISSNGAIQINDRIRCIVEDCIIKNI